MASERAATAGTVPAGSITGWHAPLPDDTAGRHAESSRDRAQPGAGPGVPVT